MKLYFITGSENKLQEIRALLSDSEYKVSKINLDLPEIQAINSKDVIIAKVKYAIKKTKKKNIFVEDTGLHFSYLNGFPGALTKWFYLRNGSKKIYSLLKNKGNYNAQAITVIGYYDGENIHCFTGTIFGKIVSPRGKTGFSWDNIFVPKGYNKTFAEMGAIEKNKISMRKKAVLKFKKYLIKSKDTNKK
ncbi:MAG: RdgB/HAM1 family non-canonical purine NTP pyrophosphatase [archaeon]|jgi:non-canonical purine NTP pyrophosphatase (RdgB/HAM1 family)